MDAPKRRMTEKRHKQRLFAELLEACGADYFDSIDPNEPTSALPGTLEKVEIMRRRADAGLHIWNADDAKG